MAATLVILLILVAVIAFAVTGRTLVLPLETAALAGTIAQVAEAMRLGPGPSAS